MQRDRPDAARANLARVGWPDARSRATSLADALNTGATHVGDDWRALVGDPEDDVDDDEPSPDDEHQKIDDDDDDGEKIFPMDDPDRNA